MTCTFVGDIGAFQVGLGVVLLLAVWTDDGLVVALGEVGFDSLVHGVGQLAPHRPQRRALGLGELTGHDELQGEARLLGVVLVHECLALIAAIGASRTGTQTPAGGPAGDDHDFTVVGDALQRLVVAESSVGAAQPQARAAGVARDAEQRADDRGELQETLLQVRAAPPGTPLPGGPVDACWDPDLAPAMRRRGLAVHEEQLLPALLADLAE